MAGSSSRSSRQIQTVRERRRDSEKVIASPCSSKSWPGADGCRELLGRCSSFLSFANKLMLSLSIQDFGQKEWAEIVSQFHDLSLLQTWEYGLAKARTGSWKVQRGIFLENEHVVGAFQALVRTIPGFHR